MEGLRRAKASGAITLGVSNNLGTPVTTEFDYAILVRASRKGWPTQASTATMAVLLTLGLEIARAGGRLSSAALEAGTQELEALPSLMDQTLQRTQEPMQALAEQLGAARFLFFCGGGPHFATAAFGAAKVKELCPIHATAIPLEEFHHYRSLKPADPLILVAPDPASHARALDTAEVGRYDGGWIAALVPDGEREITAAAQWALSLPQVNPMLAPLVYSLPLHLFAYYLAMEKFKLGLGHTPAFTP
jgi:glucosamine 6-phosphate synthetase-like amidotransferase/phosphosugar isomerase protein